MFGIETTTATKLQIGFVLLILGVAGFLLLHNSVKPVNDAVNSWREPHQYYVPTTKQIDPKKAEIWNVFTCWDGKLKIVEYTGDPTKHPFIAWENVDTRRAPNYLYYRDPLARAAKVKDPYKHAITLASYSAANGKSLGLMTNANLTTDEKNAEAAARKLMTDELESIRNRVEEGTFHSDIYKKVLDLLAAYKKLDGDPTKGGSKKALAAQEVIQAAADFLNKVDDEKSASVEKYIATISGILTADQKKIVADAGATYEKNQSTPRGGVVAQTAAPGRGGRTPATTPQPGRGGANPGRTPQPTRTPTVPANNG